MAIIIQVVDDIIGFGEVTKTNQHVVGVTEHFNIAEATHDEDISYYYLITNTLAFHETLYYSMDATRYITDTLVFQQSAYRIHPLQVNENLVFTQTTVEGGKSSNDSLSFAETLSTNVSLFVSDFLRFTSTTTAGGNRSRSATDTLTFSQSVVCYTENPNVIWSGITIPTNDVVPTVSFTSNGFSITLPAPEFNNTDSYSQTRIQRLSQSGTLLIGGSNLWPKDNGFGITLSYLSEAQVDSLRNFANNNQGVPVTYVDYEGVSWTVLITNPDFHVAQPGRNNRSIDLELQVILS